MLRIFSVLVPLVMVTPVFGMVQSKITPFGENASDALVLQNDGYVETGGQAYLQQGFIKGEKAGVWVKVPTGVKLFKVDYFRVLMGGVRNDNVGVFFQMGHAPVDGYSPMIPVEIENAATVTPGPFWNDIPAKGLEKTLPCLKAGELIGASIEFTHNGAPSVYRDADGLSNPKANTLFAIPQGWNYSVVFGLQGDWILRVVGHAATASECGG